MLVRPITSTEASRKAKDLVGQWANLKPDNPKVFIESVGAVLSVYPLGVVQECCDPRVGLAPKTEFFSIKSLTEYCDERLSFYQALAKYQPIPPARQITDGSVTKEQTNNLMAEVAEALRASNARSPLDELLAQVADARRLRIEEVQRVANEPAVYDRNEAAE